MARGGTLPPERLTPDVRARLEGLAAVARRRGQSLAQLALSWVLRSPRVTTAVVGARTVEQLNELLDVARRPVAPESWTSAKPRSRPRPPHSNGPPHR